MVIPETALTFVLIGPHQGEQKVLARSKTLDLLLLGMARAPAHLLAPRRSAFSAVAWQEISHVRSVPGLYQNDEQATLYAVTATAHITDQPDSRAEPFTFAWVGEAQGADVEPILSYFNNCVISLHQAIEATVPEKLRWELAPLLFLCARGTKARREAAAPPQPPQQSSSEKTMQLELSAWLKSLAAMLAIAVMAICAASLVQLLAWLFPRLR